MKKDIINKIQRQAAERKKIFSTYRAENVTIILYIKNFYKLIRKQFNYLTRLFLKEYKQFISPAN